MDVVGVAVTSHIHKGIPHLQSVMPIAGVCLTLSVLISATALTSKDENESFRALTSLAEAITPSPVDLITIRLVIRCKTFKCPQKELKIVISNSIK